MNQTLLIILIIAVIAYIFLDNIKETFYETFMPHDPSYFIDSCRKLTKEKNQVNNLAAIYCNKNYNIKNSKNKDTINTNINCNDLNAKQIMLENEQPSWCSKVTPEQLQLIEKELGTKLQVFDASGNINTNNIEGPNFIQNQYNIDGSTVQPYDLVTENYPAFK